MKLINYYRLQIKLLAPMFFAIGTVYFTTATFAATTIEVTTNVLHGNVRGLGLNMSDSYYEMPNRKIRGTLNFEGLRCRQIHPGMLFTNGFLSFRAQLNWNNPWFSNVYLAAKFRLVSNPARGQEGMIATIEERPVDRWENGDITTQAFFVFEHPLTGFSIPAEGVRDQGLLIDGTNLLNKGYMGVTNTSWNNNCEIVLDDTPPGSFGNAACKLKPGSYIKTLGINYVVADLSNKVFKISFYAKALSGSPILRVSFIKRTTFFEYTPPTTWQYKEFIITNYFAN